MTPGLRTFAIYAVSAACYITLGVFFPRFVLSWVEGASFLLLAVWLVPALIGRLRR